MRNTLDVVGRCTILALAALLAACSKGDGGGPPPFPAPDVSVAAVVEKQVADWDEYSGRIEAVEAVELRPRIMGYLQDVHFREGGMVHRGDLLFTIDDREYQAAVAAAEADLQRANARQAMAATELQRSEALIAAKAVAQGELESRRAEMAQAEADRQAARARLQQAQLNLQFTRIHSPIDGRVGAAMVKPGNLVMPGETMLSTVVSVDPVHVVFDGDERAYLRYQQMIRAGTRESARDTASPVQVALSNEDAFRHSGTMDFVDNVLNPNSGTIRGRAVLPNPDGVFTPGLFARVRIMGSTPKQALLIHDQAVMTDQDRKYVWIIDGNNSAQRRDVVLGEDIDGLRVVESGLVAGDRVVVNGVRKIFMPGQAVKPHDVPMDAPMPPPAPAATAETAAETTAPAGG